MDALFFKSASQPLALTFGPPKTGWRYDPLALGTLGLGWSPPWKAVVWVKESTEVVGTYGEGGAAGRRAVWQVRVVRLSDARSFTKTLSQEPPSFGSTTRGERGDPTTRLFEWLSGGSLSTVGLRGTLIDEWTGEPLPARTIRAGDSVGVTDQHGSF